MPVIIDEVVISVEVTNQVSGGAADSSSSGTDSKQEIVSECVERVLDIIKQKGER